jgi:hypothetical protein
MAFRCDVPVKMFSDTHQDMLELGNGDITRTVLKVATNNKGVQQNTSELLTWDELKFQEYAQYLCPILDWSGNPKYSNNSQYVLDINNYNIDINFAGDLKGAFWVQMPLCKPANLFRQEFMDLFHKKFGPIDFDDPNPTMGGYKADPMSLENIHCLLRRKTFQYTYDRIVTEREKMLDAGTLSWDQFDALFGLIDMGVHHGIADIAHFVNWGILNGQPVILDYGYDKKTDLIYNGKTKVIFNVYVDDDGSVRIKYKEKSNVKDNDSKGNS